MEIRLFKTTHVNAESLRTVVRFSINTSICTSMSIPSRRSNVCTMPDKRVRGRRSVKACVRAPVRCERNTGKRFWNLKFTRNDDLRTKYEKCAIPSCRIKRKNLRKIYGLDGGRSERGGFTTSPWSVPTQPRLRRIERGYDIRARRDVFGDLAA